MSSGAQECRPQNGTCGRIRIQEVIHHKVCRNIAQRPRSRSLEMSTLIKSVRRTSLYALASCRFDFFANILGFSLVQFDISVFNYVLSINHTSFYLDYTSSGRTRLCLDYFFSSNRSRLYFDGKLGRKVCTQL